MSTNGMVATRSTIFTKAEANNAIPPTRNSTAVISVSVASTNFPGCKANEATAMETNMSATERLIKRARVTDHLKGWAMKQTSYS